MEMTCMQYSIEGERLLKAHDYENAIAHFEAGLRVGTDNDAVLSAVYNQLGNACFYIGKFNKALEYHKKDLEIAERLADRPGMAKAFGNLGNTFKSLKNYVNAVRCCEAHLEITRELGDRLGEGRACYNLGNVHHAVGKSKINSKEPHVRAEGRKSVQKAIEYYKATLNITAELKDVAGEGRAVGNLGNAYTAIGEYQEAIKYHERRLAIANQANDLAAKARACGNLGNAYSALGDYTEAIRFYRQSLAVAREAGNKAGQGQAYYCLGSTYFLQKNYDLAVKNHTEHQNVAAEVGDKQGQLKSWYNLRNTYRAMGNEGKAEEFRKMIEGAQPQRVAMPTSAPPKAGGTAGSTSTVGASAAEKKKKKKKGIFKKAPTNEVQAFTVDDSDDEEIVSSRATGTDVAAKPKANAATEWLNAAVEESKHEQQARPAAQAAASGPSTLPNDFFDMLEAANSRGFDDQRADLTRVNPALLAQSNVEEEEQFFDLLVTTQSTRFDDQRSAAPSDNVVRNVAPTAQAGVQPKSTVLQEELDADSMSFFEMLAVAKKTKA